MPMPLFAGKNGLAGYGQVRTSVCISDGEGHGGGGG